MSRQSRQAGFDGIDLMFLPLILSRTAGLAEKSAEEAGSAGKCHGGTGKIATCSVDSDNMRTYVKPRFDFPNVSVVNRLSCVRRCTSSPVSEMKRVWFALS